mmetsp:Transcript_132461/g.229798  ORF Transcript_132461/g.229798 Transcript_132461/m.229798 type:complete len:250 (-) Transcript_132461:479-1228(-)
MDAEGIQVAICSPSSKVCTSTDGRLRTTFENEISVSPAKSSLNLCKCRASHSISRLSVRVSLKFCSASSRPSHCAPGRTLRQVMNAHRAPRSAATRSRIDGWTTFTATIDGLSLGGAGGPQNQRRRPNGLKAPSVCPATAGEGEGAEARNFARWTCAMQPLCRGAASNHSKTSLRQSGPSSLRSAASVSAKEWTGLSLKRPPRCVHSSGENRSGLVAIHCPSLMNVGPAFTSAQDRALCQYCRGIALMQ